MILALECLIGTDGRVEVRSHNYAEEGYSYFPNVDINDYLARYAGKLLGAGPIGCSGYSTMLVEIDDRLAGGKMHRD